MKPRISRRIGILAALIVVLMLGGITAFALSGTLTVTETTVSTQTITLTTVSTSTVASTVTTTPSTAITQTNTLETQPVIGLATSTTTSVSSITTITTSTAPTVTSSITTTTTTTATSTMFNPPVMYWTAHDANPNSLYRSVNPFSSGIFAESISGFPNSGSDPTGTVGMTITPTNASATISLGFYMIVGTLSTLNVGAGHGLTLTGTGFTANIWVGSFNWSYVSMGTDVQTSLGSGSTGNGVQGAQTINGATSFSGFQGACGGTHTIAQLAAGACSASYNASTPVAIWIGVLDTFPTTSVATLNSMYLS